jgi:hypothetical protein
MMKALSQIGRPGAHEERRILERAPAHTRLRLSASERGEESRKYFRGRGSAQVLEKAQNGQGNPRKTEHFPLMDFAQAWLDLAKFG